MQRQVLYPGLLRRRLPGAAEVAHFRAEEAERAGEHTTCLAEADNPDFLPGKFPPLRLPLPVPEAVEEPDEFADRILNHTFVTVVLDSEHSNPVLPRRGDIHIARGFAVQCTAHTYIPDSRAALYDVPAYPCPERHEYRIGCAYPADYLGVIRRRVVMHLHFIRQCMQFPDRLLVYEDILYGHYFPEFFHCIVFFCKNNDYPLLTSCPAGAAFVEQKLVYIDSLLLPETPHGKC